MFFAAAAFAVVAASASMALAQDVSFNGATPTQCQNSTFSYNASAGSYYAAVVPAENACSGDPLAEFYNVTGGAVNYFVNIAAGTQIQVYVADSNGNEFWSPPMTVGDGDSSCLGAASAASSTSVTSTSTSSSSSTSSVPSVYVAPANFASSARPTTTPASDSSVNDTPPANAASSGASSVAVSFTLLGGALLAAAALF